MISSLRSIFIFGSAVVVTASIIGCATSAPKVADSKPTWQPTQPTYEEKVSARSLDQVKASCPGDNQWENLEWKKITPLANSCVKAKDWHKVEKMGDWLATHASLTPWGAFYMGLAAEGRKDYPRAIWMFELALKKAPKEGIFHYELGRIHWELGQDAAAVAEMKMASDLSPSLVEAHALMGQLALQRQEISEAERYFQKALSVNSKHLPSILGMASAKINSKDYVKAEEYLGQAVDLNPRASKPRLALAQVQEEHLKKYNDALATYRQIKQMSADRKLDEVIQLNLDEKIRNLEKSASQVNKGGQLTERTPTGERQVRK